MQFSDYTMKLAINSAPERVSFESRYAEVQEDKVEVSHAATLAAWSVAQLIHGPSQQVTQYNHEKQIEFSPRLSVASFCGNIL